MIIVDRVPQSDDQFYLTQRFPLTTSLGFDPIKRVVTVTVTLPMEFEGSRYHNGMTPFDAKLHRLCEFLRNQGEPA